MSLPNYVGENITRLRDKIFYLEPIATQHFRYEAKVEQDQAREQLDYWQNVARWYNDTVNSILARATEAQPKKVLRAAQNGTVVEQWEKAETPAQALSRWERIYQNSLEQRLKAWVAELVERGQLDADYAKTLALREPINEAQAQRDREAAKARVKFDKGYWEYRKLVEQHGKSKGRDWGADWRDMLQIFNKGKYTFDAKGLAEWGMAAGKRGLIPVTEGAKSGVKGILAKIGV